MGDQMTLKESQKRESRSSRTRSSMTTSSTSSLASSVSSKTITNSLSISQFSNLFKSDTSISNGKLDGSVDSVVVQLKETAMPLPPATLISIPPKPPPKLKTSPTTSRSSSCPNHTVTSNEKEANKETAPSNIPSGFRASLSRLFNRTPSPNRRSLKSCDRSPSPKSRNRLSPLFSRNSAPPSSTESSQPSINKSICSPSSSPKLFDKSERTFNIPASLVFQNNDSSSASKSDKILENKAMNDKNQDLKSSDNNLDKTEHLKITKSWSSSP